MAIIANESWKYDLKTLESISDEFKLVERFFKITSRETSIFPDNLKNFQISKVIEQHKNEIEWKRTNLMLFHGTSRKGTAGILEHGFRNSPSGTFGGGVYMTESSYRASLVSVRSYFRPKTSYFIFVNEVFGSDNLQTVFYETYTFPPSSEYATLKNTTLTKYMHNLSAKITEENYKEDVQGRRYRNTAVDESSFNDEFVADCEIVIPRYLIRFETTKRMYKPDLRWIMLHVLVILGLILMIVVFIVYI